MKGKLYWVVIIIIIFIIISMNFFQIKWLQAIIITVAGKAFDIDERKAEETMNLMHIINFIHIAKSVGFRFFF